MTWLKIDDRMADNPKFLALGDDYELGLAVYLAGLCYCGAHLTDGNIPKVRAHTLTPNAQRIAPKLVEAGLWHKNSNGYTVNDYLEYNPSREKVESERQAWRERQQKSRHAKSHDVTPGKSHEE